MITNTISETTCNICNGQGSIIFKAEILQQYNAAYFKCNNCGFIQTEKPYWLSEAYASAITELDVGLLHRNILYSTQLENLFIKNLFDPDGKFIDYGGGYGVFVRLMRDKGFDFYRHDIYCDNIFARHFDITDIEATVRFELLTSFEVFEHLENPLEGLEKMLTFSDNILFSTMLVPETNPTPATWWYFAPETGQHISFYTLKSLQTLAKTFNLNIYTNGASLHLFSKKKFACNPFEKPTPSGRLKRLLSIIKPSLPIKKRETLLMEDLEFISKKIYK